MVDMILMVSVNNLGCGGFIVFVVVVYVVMIVVGIFFVIVVDLSSTFISVARGTRIIVNVVFKVDVIFVIFVGLVFIFFEVSVWFEM